MKTYQIDLLLRFSFHIAEFQDNKAILSPLTETLKIDGQPCYSRDITVPGEIKKYKVMEVGHTLILSYRLLGDVGTWSHDLQGNDIIKSFNYVEIMAHELNLITVHLDDTELDEIIQKVVQQNQPMVDDYRKGKKGAVNSLMGLVMKSRKGLSASSVKERLTVFLEA